MEWNNFTESKREYPEVLVQNSIQGFSKATGSLLEIKVTPVGEYAGDIYTDFEFRVVLLSNHIKTYQFEIFRFGYNVDIFPVRTILEESIYQNVTNKKMSHKQIMKHVNEIEFVSFLKTVFDSKRFEEIVSGLMKISRKYIDE